MQNLAKIRICVGLVVWLFLVLTSAQFGGLASSGPGVGITPVDVGGVASLPIRGVGGDAGIGAIARNIRRNRFSDAPDVYSPVGGAPHPTDYGYTDEEEDIARFTGDIASAKKTNTWELVYLDRLRIRRAPDHSPFDKKEYSYRPGIREKQITYLSDSSLTPRFYESGRERSDIRSIVRSRTANTRAGESDDREGSSTRESNRNERESRVSYTVTQPSWYRLPNGSVFYGYITQPTTTNSGISSRSNSYYNTPNTLPRAYRQPIGTEYSGYDSSPSTTRSNKYKTAIPRR